MKHLARAAALLLAAASLPALAGGDYEVSIVTPAAKANERAVVRVALTPKGAFHVNTDYPASLKVAAPAGVKVEKEAQTKADAKKFEKQALEFEVAFVSGEAGKKSFTGELRFAVCTETMCNPTKEKVAFDVEVK